MSNKEKINSTSKGTTILKSVDVNLGKEIVNNFKKIKNPLDKMDYLEKMVQVKKRIDKDFLEGFKFAVKSFGKENKELKVNAYSKVSEALKAEELPDSVVKTKGVSIEGLASFSASLTTRSRRNQLGQYGPEWKLNSKIKAYRFIDELNFKRPWAESKKYTFSEIPKKEGLVIKPTQGANSRGVYLIFSLDRIFDVKNSKMLSSWSDLVNCVSEDLRLKRVNADEWIVEELIYQDDEKALPANDLKFYCFYGKVGLVLEVSRFPQKRYCWWTPNGDIIDTGKYNKSLFFGDGFLQTHIKQVETISAEIPAPFVRIDMFNSNNDLVFGEFTPRPGNYNEFNKDTDQLLGDYFLEAEGRLMNDLLKGKKFENFQKFLSK